MECFSGFWFRRSDCDDISSWAFENYPKTEPQPKPGYELSKRDLNYFQTILDIDMEANEKMDDLRDVIRQKAEKHRTYYETLITDGTETCKTCDDVDREMARDVSTDNERRRNPNDENENENENSKHWRDNSEPSEAGNAGLEGLAPEKRQRKQGVYGLSGGGGKNSCVTGVVKGEDDSSIFRSVKQLRQNYLAMLEKTAIDLSDKSCSDKESLLIPPPSGYSSSTASGASDDERDKSWGKKNAIRRSGSADSAVHSDDEENSEEKKDELYYRSVNDACAIRSPYSPRGSIDHSNVPSKTLIEAQFVPLPVDRKFSVDCVSDADPEGIGFDSRRQSCFSEGEGEPRYRYWRTPSVVVSDYSDDIMGLTLEDIEYIRNRKEHYSSPDSSLHSSCSNLNYCGSSISGLDGDYVLSRPYRKSSDCSTCSTLSDDEVEPALVRRKNREPSGWRKLRNIVQWTPFFQTYKKQRYPWVQLAGHQGNFKAGPDQGTILKKLCMKEEKCFKILMKDVLRPYVPEYKGLVASDDGECSYIQLQDLLGDFVSPCVMDCKIGVRTYLEEELAKAKEKPKLRKDMYEKMCQIDQNAPSEEEHKLKGVTKPRYMVWRETISSTATLGFRIEGIRSADGTSTKDFKTTKTIEQIMESFEKFTNEFPHAIPKYIQRLKAIKATLETSNFFNSHEVIGSSLLFVHDRYNANVWLIDFAKTIVLPDEIKITHSCKWKVGNHEDGYMIGVNNLIKIFKTMLENQPVSISPPLSLQDPPEMAQEVEIKLSDIKVQEQINDARQNVKRDDNT